MMQKFSFICAPVFAALLLTAGGGSAHAQAQLYVLESTAASVKVGTAIAMTDQITVPAGASIRVVMPSGKTQTIKGPYSGPAADLAQGQKPNDSIMDWIRRIAQTGGSNEKTPGVTRSMRPAPEPPASFSWTAVPVTADSTFCVEKGAKLQLRRGSAQTADRISVVDTTTTERGEVEFGAGSQTASWPASIPLQDDRTYTLLAPDNRTQGKVKVRVLDRLPAEDDILAELAARNCKTQFDAWIRQKVETGKRKAS